MPGGVETILDGRVNIWDDVVLGLPSGTGRSSDGRADPVQARTETPRHRGVVYLSLCLRASAANLTLARQLLGCEGPDELPDLDVRDQDDGIT